MNILGLATRLDCDSIRIGYGAGAVLDRHGSKHRYKCVNSTSYIYLERTHKEVPAWISTIQVRLVSEVESQLLSFTHAKKRSEFKEQQE